MKKWESKDEEQIPNIKHMAFQYPQLIYLSTQESKENENKLKLSRRKWSQDELTKRPSHKWNT